VPRRPSLSDRLVEPGRGRDAFRPDPPRPGHSDQAGADGGRATVDRPPSTVTGGPSTADGNPLTVDRRPETVDGSGTAGLTGGGTGSWEEQNKRVTFYCPRWLLADIENEMAQSGRSKTAVIVDALRNDLSTS
jgi:hypothetical protein